MSSVSVAFLSGGASVSAGGNPCVSLGHCRASSVVPALGITLEGRGYQTTCKSERGGGGRAIFPRIWGFW